MTAKNVILTNHRCYKNTTFAHLQAWAASRSQTIVTTVDARPRELITVLTNTPAELTHNIFMLDPRSREFRTRPLVAVHSQLDWESLFEPEDVQQAQAWLRLLEVDLPKSCANSHLFRADFLCGLTCISAARTLMQLAYQTCNVKCHLFHARHIVDTVMTYDEHTLILGDVLPRLATDLVNPTILQMHVHSDLLRSRHLAEDSRPVQPSDYEIHLGSSVSNAVDRYLRLVLSLYYEDRRQIRHRDIASNDSVF